MCVCVPDVSAYMRIAHHKHQLKKKLNIFSAKFICVFLFFIFSFLRYFRIHFISILYIFGCAVHKCNAEIAEIVTHVSDEEILFNLPALVHATIAVAHSLHEKLHADDGATDAI